MAEQITNAADKMLRALYKEYRRRLEAGQSQWEARDISVEFFKEHKSLGKLPQDDIFCLITELHREKFLQADLSGNCLLLEKAIVYSENRTKNGLSEVLSFLSQFIP